MPLATNVELFVELKRAHFLSMGKFIPVFVCCDAIRHFASNKCDILSPTRAAKQWSISLFPMNITDIELRICVGRC